MNGFALTASVSLPCFSLPPCLCVFNHPFLSLSPSPFSSQIYKAHICCDFQIQGLVGHVKQEGKSPVRILKCEACFSFPFHDISGNVQMFDVTLFTKSETCLWLKLPCKPEVGSALPAVSERRLSALWLSLSCVVLPFQTPRGRDNGIVRSCSCSAAWTIDMMFPKAEFTVNLLDFFQELDVRPSKWG